MSDLLNTSGKCRACGGTVRNIASMKKCSLAKLAERHAETCPGLLRATKRKESA